jgi:hypothetical protein
LDWPTRRKTFSGVASLAKQRSKQVVIAENIKKPKRQYTTVLVLRLFLMKSERLLNPDK